LFYSVPHRGDNENPEQSGGAGGLDKQQQQMGTMLYISGCSVNE